MSVVGNTVEVLGVLGKAMSGVVARGVGSDCVTQGERDIYLWGVLLSRIVHKEVECGEEVEWWALSSSIFPQPVVLTSGGEGGVVGVRTRIFIKIPSVWGGRDG
jgi:hypothetical protein